MRSGWGREGFERISFLLNFNGKLGLNKMLIYEDYEKRSFGDCFFVFMDW